MAVIEKGDSLFLQAGHGTHVVGLEVVHYSPEPIQPFLMNRKNSRALE